MSSSRRSKGVAKCNTLNKTLKPPKTPANRICRLRIAPLEYTPFKNMYFSLLSKQVKSAPNTFNVLNLNPSNISAKPVGTITLVDIDEIKKRPLEVPSNNNRKIAKIKPVLQNEPIKATSPIKRPVDEISTKYEKRFFLSYVSIRTLNLEDFTQIGPLTYTYKPSTTRPAKDLPRYKRNKVSFAIPPVNNLTSRTRKIISKNVTITPKSYNISPKSYNISSKSNYITPKSSKISRNSNITPKSNDFALKGNKISGNSNITPKSKIEQVPRRKQIPQKDLALTKTSENNLLPAASSTPIAHNLIVENHSPNKFFDPYETHLSINFSFESVAYKISNVRNGIKLPSRQWNCSLWQHIVSNKKSSRKVITKYNDNGTLKILYHDDNIVKKKICNFGDITKMKSFNFRRYKLTFKDDIVVMEPDRCVTVYRNGDYDIRVQGKLLNLYTAPLKVKNISDIEILLDIVDSAKLTELCIDD